MRIPPDNMTIGEARQHGRLGDEQLVHLNRHEVKALRAMTPTGQLTRNPVTGEEEAFLPFLLSLLPSLFPAIGTAVGGAATAAGLGGTAASLLANPLTLSALGSGLGTWAETGDLGKGLQAGLTGAALGGLMGGAGSLLGKMGAGAVPGAAAGAGNTVGQAASQAAQNTAATAGQALGQAPQSLASMTPGQVMGFGNGSVLGANPLSQAAMAPLERAATPNALYNLAELSPGVAGPMPASLAGMDDPGGLMTGHSPDALAGLAQNGAYKPLGWLGSAAVGYPGEVISADAMNSMGTSGKKKKPGPYDTEQMPLPRTINTPPPGYEHGLMPEWDWFSPNGPGYATGGLVGGGNMTAGGFAPSTPKPDVMAMGGGYNTGVVGPQMNPPPRPMGPAAMPPPTHAPYNTAPAPQGMPPMPQGMPSGFDPQRFMGNQMSGGFAGHMGQGGFGQGGLFSGDWRQRIMDRRMNGGPDGNRPHDGWRQDGRPPQVGMMPPEMQRMQGPGFAEGGPVGKPYDPAAFDFTRAVITAQPYTQPSGAGVVAYQPPAGGHPAPAPISSGNTNTGPGAAFGNAISGTGAIGNAALAALANQASGQNPSPFPSPNNRGMPVYQNPATDYLAMMEQINGRPGVREFADGGRVPKKPLASRMREAGEPMSGNIEDRRGYVSRQADRQALRLANRVDPMDLLFGRRNYNEVFQPVQQLPQERRAGWRGQMYGNSGEMLSPDYNAYARGGYVDGPGDGTSDSVPAIINGRGPAKLSDGEFVVDAQTVAHLGNGSNKAGAKRLEQMVKQVRKKKTGRTRMPPRI